MRIVGKKTERKTNISLFPADIHTYKLTFVSFFYFFCPFPLGEGTQKKTEKKLTNVSLYVCMSAGNSEMLVFLSVFSPTMRNFQDF